MTTKFLITACLVAVLAGCSTKPLLVSSNSPESIAAWEARRVALEVVRSWDMRGRLAVRTRDDGGSATLLWSREDDEHRMELYGPFGGGRVIIEQKADGAVMRDNKDGEFHDKSAEALLYRRAGWHVPFDQLKYWLKGMPAPGDYQALTLDDSGRTIGFQQSGWDVAIMNYTESQGFELPRKLFVRALPGTVHLVDEDGTDLGDKLEVKVILKRWLVESL